MNNRLLKARELLAVLLTGKILTAQQAKEIIGDEELSRVLEIIRNKHYVPVTCSRIKPTSYSIMPEDIAAYHGDRRKQIQEQKSKKLACEYNRLADRLIRKALGEKGGIARTRTLMRQVGAVIEQYELETQNADDVACVVDLPEAANS